MGGIRSAAAGAALAILLASPAPVRADSALLQDAVGLASFAIFLESGATGMVIAVVDGEDSLVVGQGETAEGNGQEPDGKTLVRIGSVSKVFTGEMLAALAAGGQVELTDPLQHYAPEGIQLPTFEGRGITLLDLATHTAALPRQLFEGAPPNAPPFSWPTAADEYDWLANQQLPWAPGSAASYSNFGFDLLGAALMTAAGESYGDLLRDRITEPLGMADTVVAPSAEQCTRLMTGYGIPGADAGPCVDTSVIAGSGGVYSTADDMALWLKHHLAASDPGAAATLDLDHAMYRPRAALTAAIGFDETAAPMDGLGLGWVVVMPDGHRPLIIQKSGALAGFMSYVAFAPGTGVGVFVSVNRIDLGAFANMTAGANTIIESLVPR